MSTAYPTDDYTRQPYPTSGQSTPSAGDAWNPDEYDFIPLQSAPDADAIERDAESREFRDVEPGDHLLTVVGFLGRPEARLQTGFLRGQQVSWESEMVKVRFAKKADRQATIIDNFFLPPRDPRQQEAYLHATKTPEGGNPGFGAAKFGHFISRLGFPFAPGAPLPAEACRLGNWIGRDVHATVAQERVGREGPRMNQQTGLPYPPRTQIKLFSYRPAAPAGVQQAQAPTVARASASQAPPRGQAAHAPANPLAAAGLDDL